MQLRISQRGYLGPFNAGNLPVLIHWTFPVGGIFVAFFLGDLTWETTIPLIFAYTILILIHEFGHAIAAMAAGSKVQAVLVTGAGGVCFADEPGSLMSRFAFYAGGIVAQVFVLFLAVGFIVAFGNPDSKVLNVFILVFTIVNCALILINVLPYEGTDGRKIWDLLREWRNEA